MQYDPKNRRQERATRQVGGLVKVVVVCRFLGIGSYLPFLALDQLDRARDDFLSHA